MNATLFVKNLDSGIVEEVKLTPVDEGFTGLLTLGDSANYELFVRAEDNSFYRETTPETLVVKKGAVPVVQKVNQTTVKQTKNDQSFSWISVGMAIIGVIGLTAVMFAIVKRKKANRDFTGKFVVEIKNEATGEFTQTKNVDLKG